MTTTKTEKFIVDLFMYFYILFNKTKTYLINIYEDFKKEKEWAISTISLCLCYCPLFSLVVYEKFLYTSIIDFWLCSAFMLFFIQHTRYWWTGLNEEDSDRSFRIFVFLLIPFAMLKIIPKLYEEFIKGVL